MHPNINVRRRSGHDTEACISYLLVGAILEISSVKTASNMGTYPDNIDANKLILSKTCNNVHEKNGRDIMENHGVLKYQKPYLA